MSSSSAKQLPKLEFYDILQANSPLPWSPFTARTFLALNLLDLPFTRHRIPMADIKATFQSFGVAPPEDDEPYTLPVLAITYPGKGSNERELVTDSKDIAEKLQSLYLEHFGGDATNSLFPHPEERSRDLTTKANKALQLRPNNRWWSIIPEVRFILDPKSSEYFSVDRQKRWGKSMDEFSQLAKQNEQEHGGKLKIFEQTLEPYAKLYKENAKDGEDWLGGNRPIYADIIVLAAIQWFLCANKDATTQAMKNVDGGRLYTLWNKSQDLWHKNLS